MPFTSIQRLRGGARSRTVPPPPLALLALEPVRATADFCASLVAPLPTDGGDGHPVLVLPGLATGDWSTMRLRHVLREAGYDAHAWGLGVNRGPHGDFDEWLGEHLLPKLEELHHGGEGRAVSLVGWSLGGIYARELAKRAPSLVRHVITLGTPFNAPHASHAGAVYRLLNGSDARLTPALARRLRAEPPVPTTAIYSRSDGVVAWQACRTSPRAAQAHNIEVDASHCGMGSHPRVLRLVIERLAAVPEPRRGAWTSTIAGEGSDDDSGRSSQPARRAHPGAGGGAAQATWPPGFRGLGTPS